MNTQTYSPNWLTTYLPKNPVAPNTVTTMPLKDARPPVPLLYAARLSY